MFQTTIQGSPSLTVNNDQVTHNMSNPAVKEQSSYAGADKLQSKHRHTPNPTHRYHLCPQRPVTKNK